MRCFLLIFCGDTSGSFPVKIISAIIGFSLAATLLSFLYIGTGFPVWMRWPVEFFFMPAK
jgi:predicted membrane-bound dolichyl-phosphate-mannose-protein mannosyltransferase